MKQSKLELVWRNNSGFGILLANNIRDLDTIPRSMLLISAVEFHNCLFTPFQSNNSPHIHISPRTIKLHFALHMSYILRCNAPEESVPAGTLSLIIIAIGARGKLSGRKRGGENLCRDAQHFSSGLPGFRDFNPFAGQNPRCL